MKFFATFLASRYKKEFTTVFVILSLLIFLPFFSVIVAANTGVNAVSDVLAAVNPTTHLVEVFDGDGNKIEELELSTTWPVSGTVTDEFGTSETWRRLLGLGHHTGIDISNVMYTPITPFTEGAVLAVDNTDDSACGRSITIKHTDRIKSQYCHLDSAAELAADTPVKPGDVIGYLGSTGTSTGPHLHYMIYVSGIPVNPRTFMVGEPEKL